MRRDECKCIHESGGDTMYRRLKHMCVYETREWESSLIHGGASASFYAETWQSQRTANIRQFTAHVAINSASLSLACSLSHLKESSCVVALTRNSTLHFATLLASCFSRLYNSHTLHGRISTSATFAAAADRAFALYLRPHRADHILFILLRAKVYLKDLPRHQLHGPCRAESL